MDNDMKIKDILDKLNTSCCPFAGKGKEQWLTEVLFKSSFERYNLIEWILDKLGIDVSETPGDESSSESKIENLKIILSSVGVCGEEDTDIIEGTATMQKQFEFWTLLCGMLSKRNELNTSCFENSDPDNSDFERNISNKYEASCEYIDKVCETVNFFDCFDRKLQLFPAHVDKEVKEFFQKSSHDENYELLEDYCNDLKPVFQKSGASITTEEIKQNYFERFGTPKLNTELNDFMEVGDKTIELKEKYEDGVIPEKNQLKNIEKNISETLGNIENVSSEFENAYKSLKPYLGNVSHEEFIDVGPAFKTTENKLNSVLQLRNSATTLKSLDVELENLSSQLSEYQMSSRSGYLSDDKLGEYLEVLSKTEQEEKKH